MTGERCTRSSPATSPGSRRGCAIGAATPTSSPRSSTTPSWSVWQKPGKYKGEGEVAAWLWGIAIRTLLHRLRPRKSVVERLVQLRPEHHPSAEEAVLLRVEHSDVGQALQRLSPELLAVVQATVLDGLSTREAAELLGIPSGTVKSRMSRARLELREALL